MTLPRISLEFGLRYDRLPAPGEPQNTVSCIEWKKDRASAFSAMYSSEPAGALNKVVVCREVGPTRVVSVEALG
jgi:hypothetical protein